MTEFRNSSDLMQMIVRVAHKIADEYGHEEEAREILAAAHELRCRSLRGSMPENYVLTDLANLLADNGIKFAVIGGVALIVHGQVRDTDDIDVLVSNLPDPEKLGDVEYMKKFGFYKAKSSTGTMVTIDHRKLGQVELLVANDDFRLWALQHAQNETVLGRSVPVISAAALIGLKIRAGREKDLPDILSVLLKSKPSLDEVKTFLTKEEISELDKLESKPAKT